MGSVRVRPSEPPYVSTGTAIAGTVARGARAPIAKAFVRYSTPGNRVILWAHVVARTSPARRHSRVGRTGCRLRTPRNLSRRCLEERWAGPRLPSRDLADPGPLPRRRAARSTGNGQARRGGERRLFRRGLPPRPGRRLACARSPAGDVDARA